jgi:hypothetical protein
LRHRSGVPKLISLAERSANLELRRVVAADAQFLFTLNHDSKAIDAAIDLQLPFTPAEVLDVVRGERVEFRTNGAHVLLSTHVEPEEVSVIKISGKDKK